MVSNSKLVTCMFQNKTDQAYRDEGTEVLGLQWCNTSDEFSFEGLDLNTQTELTYTKRSILSLIAKIFDHLGFINPFVMFGKIHFQEVWMLGLQWDDKLPQGVKNKFER